MLKQLGSFIASMPWNVGWKPGSGEARKAWRAGGNCRVSSVHVSTREKVLLCVEKKVSLAKRVHFIAYTKAGPQSNR